MHMRSHSTRVLTWTFALRRQGPQGEIQRVSLLGAMRDDELGEVRGLAHLVDDKVVDDKALLAMPSSQAALRVRLVVRMTSMFW